MATIERFKESIVIDYVKWHDVEALAGLKVPPAEAALLSDGTKICRAVMEHAPHLLDEGCRTQMLVRNSSIKDDALAAMDQAAEFHLPDLVDRPRRGR